MTCVWRRTVCLSCLFFAQKHLVFLSSFPNWCWGGTSDPLVLMFSSVVWVIFLHLNCGFHHCCFMASFNLHRCHNWPLLLISSTNRRSEEVKWKKVNRNRRSWMKAITSLITAAPWGEHFPLINFCFSDETRRLFFMWWKSCSYMRCVGWAECQKNDNTPSTRLSNGIQKVVWTTVKRAAR